MCENGAGKGDSKGEVGRWKSMSTRWSKWRRQWLERTDSVISSVMISICAAVLSCYALYKRQQLCSCSSLRWKVTRWAKMSNHVVRDVAMPSLSKPVKSARGNPSMLSPIQCSDVRVPSSTVTGNTVTTSRPRKLQCPPVSSRKTIQS